MVYQMYEFFSALSEYRNLILAAILLVAVIMLIVALVSGLKKIRAMQEEDAQTLSDDSLKNMDYSSLASKQKAAVLRQVVAPDAVDPGPNKYLIISDGGKDVYIRNLTIVSMPRRDKFANTFSGLMDFPNVTSSVFIEPISEAQMTSKMDNHIKILASEYSAANGDPNRQRKLQSQYNDASAFAAQVESGENRFFRVGFVFSIIADSLRDLNKQTDLFRAQAAAKNIQISNCISVQAEAYVANAPLNNMVSTASAFIKRDMIKFYQMDKYSVSAIYNYTQSSYSHRNGIALGRDMQTAAPVIFDIYDPSHDGFTLCIAGKTGCGKSATIKMMCCRQLLQGYHFVAIDSQAKKGVSEGEYAGLAQMAGGVNFQISNSSNEIMNIFEVSETTKTVKSSDDTVHEIRTLDLTDKIAMVANIIEAMVRGNNEVKDIQTATFIHRIVTDNLKNLYKSFNIIDGDPDSLYILSDTVGNGGVTAGQKMRTLPTLTDFYKQILVSRKENDDPTLRDTYNLIVMSLVDYVKELYYSERTCRFFKREEYLKLPFIEGSKGRQWTNDRGMREAVIEVKGIRSYFDGQSSVHISKDVPFTNIDISQLPDSEKTLARQVAMDFVNENFIKKNSEKLAGADKLVCIFDEAHENFRNQYARATLDGAVRTARKRNVSIILCSQTMAEYDNYPETQAILTQAAIKFVFKQDYQHRGFLTEKLGLTSAQADYIINSLGGNPDDDTDKNRHRGEMCIIDNKQVTFVKVDYLKRTEQLPVETDARAIRSLYKTGAVGTQQETA